MVFTYRNSELDTATMVAFSTGLEWMPTIYVDSERTAFLELRRKRWADSHFRCLPRREVLRYADLYNIAGLRELMTLSPVVGTAETIVDGLTSYIYKLKRGHDCEARKLAPDVQQLVDCMAAICVTENVKVAAARWANPFVREPALVPESATACTPV